ncbi:MAG TPA: CAP domain-containing protein [Phycisphaerae bacterium]|nr:CAP domain-containing protein [Phycisphaerae bacterium]
MARSWTNLSGIIGLLATALVVGCNSAGAPAADNGGAATLGQRDAGSAGAGGSSTAARCISQADDEELAGQILALVNIERARVGVTPLTVSEELTLAAEDYACTLIGDDFFDHVHPVTGEGPGARAADAGYEYFAVGENLAAGQPTAAEAFEGWMNSKSHRYNLLSPEWRETGIGVRRGGSLRVYWVQEFGKPVRSDSLVLNPEAELLEPAYGE